jgi:hypothetical protein
MYLSSILSNISQISSCVLDYLPKFYHIHNVNWRWNPLAYSSPTCDSAPPYDACFPVYRLLIVIQAMNYNCEVLDCVKHSGSHVYHLF